MSSAVETLIERVMNELHRIVQTETVIGEPVKIGTVTLIPVSKISFGFGAGGGQEGKGQSGTGTGGGAMVEPIAFVIIDDQGKVQLLSMRDKEVSLGQLIHLMPEAFEKIRNFVGKKRHGKGSSEKTEEKKPEPDKDAAKQPS